MDIIGWLSLIILFLFLYFLPSFVARNKRNSLAIFVLNFFLGWTIWGWVGALIWACLKEERPQLCRHKAYTSSSPY
ncbi:MAG: superinfection immunity protein [Verrucomicrobia bacterium]|nr:superinfection immunity protein [Verrucomicrobiota bacterium]